MEYLLGGTATVGIAGVVALGIYLAKMAGNNRSDLHKLVQSVKDLADARRDNDGYKRSVEERDNALAALQEQLIHERAAVEAASAALGRATKKLAARGDAVSVAADLNSALLRLSEMSSVSRPPPSEGGDDD